jgi:hypothetical protein
MEGGPAGGESDQRKGEGESERRRKRGEDRSLQGARLRARRAGPAVLRTRGLEAAGVPCSVGSGSGPGGAAAAQRPRGRLSAGRLCTPRAPGAALGRICTLPREAGSPGLALA